MNSGQMQSDFDKQRRKARKTLTALIAAFLGVVLGGVVVLVIASLLSRDPSPSISRRDFDEAKQRWAERGPENYDVHVEAFGRQAAIYRVQVRDGKTATLIRNDIPIGRASARETWSVLGMFDTIEYDLAAIDRYRELHPDARRDPLTLRATFHPELGYPQQYRRIEFGSDIEVRWEVIAFTVVQPE